MMWILARSGTKSLFSWYYCSTWYNIQLDDDGGGDDDNNYDDPQVGSDNVDDKMMAMMMMMIAGQAHII